MTTALAFWKRVVEDRSDFLERIIALLDEQGIRYCVVGGAGVNAYVEPVITLGLDIVVAVDQLDEARGLLEAHFTVREFEHSLNVTDPGSRLQVQLQRDERLASFPERAHVRDVLDLPLPVASPEDLVRAKVWAASDDARRPTKRAKDFLDLGRLIEAYPDLIDLVPEDMRARLPS